MAKVMMRCPTSGKDFDTGLDIPRKTGLKEVGISTVNCPYCHHHHYLRRVFFDGNTPPAYFPADGLEAAPAFAMEVGTIIGAMAFLELYIPQIYSKLTGHEDVVRIFGAFSSVSQKVTVLEVLRDTWPHNPETKADLDILIKKFRECSVIRDQYAHAKYHYSGGTTITVFPYFCDTRKRKDAVEVSIYKLRDDADFIWSTKMMIREFIMNSTRPTR